MMVKESRQPPNISPSIGAAATVEMNVDQGSIDQEIPSEAQLVLLSLDYLRDLRRAYANPEDLQTAEGINADWLTIAIYALNKSFEPSTHLDQGNDAWMVTPSENINPNTNNTRHHHRHLHHHSSHDPTKRLPSLEEMTREIVYMENPHGDDADSSYQSQRGGEDMDAYAWYEYDDQHPANAHRFYALNGLASGNNSGTGPLMLGEIAAAGLACLQARSRYQAEQEMIASPLFEQFLHAVKGKGFFNDPDNESPSGMGADPLMSEAEEEEARLLRKNQVYKERFAKVVAKFRTKLALKAEANGLTTNLSDQHHTRRMRRVVATRKERNYSSPPRNNNDRHKLDNNEHRRQQRNSSRTPPPSRDRDHHHYGQRNSSRTPSPARNRYSQASLGGETPSASIPPTYPHGSHHNPKDLEEAEKLKNAGNAYMQKKEYESAATAYTQALRVSPSGPNSHVYYSNRAAALLSMKRFQEAISDSERSLALKPNYGKAHARLGLAHFLLGGYEQAIEAYTVSLKYEPNNKSSKAYLEKAQRRLGANHHGSGDSVALGASFSVVSEWDKSNKRGGGTATTGVNTTGAAIGGSGANKESSSHHHHQHPNHREAEKYKVKGNQYMANREYEKALEAYTEAIEMCPDGPQSHVYFSNRAAALCYLEHYQEAAQDSESSLKLKPTYGKAHARLGLSRFFLQEYAGAVAAYTAALKYDPDNAASKSYLAKAKLKLEQRNGGSSLLRKKQHDSSNHSRQRQQQPQNNSFSSSQYPQQPSMDARRLMDDPDMLRMAQKAMDNPNSSLLEDPDIQNIARKAMHDPTLMAVLQHGLK